MGTFLHEAVKVKSFYFKQKTSVKINHIMSVWQLLFNIFMNIIQMSLQGIFPCKHFVTYQACRIFIFFTKCFNMTVLSMFLCECFTSNKTLVNSLVFSCQQFSNVSPRHISLQTFFSI